MADSHQLNMPDMSTPSPRLRPTNPPDPAPLPEGHCRFILTNPEVKGLRCGCTHFDLNRRSIPSATCECGHSACYHMNDNGPPTTPENLELEELKQRLLIMEKEQAELKKGIKLLESRVLRDSADQDDSMVIRVSELEEALEKSRTETGHEVRNAYRNLGRAWDSISELIKYKEQAESHNHAVDERLKRMNAELDRLGERQMELVDVDIRMEERVERIESLVDRTERRGSADQPHRLQGRGSSAELEDRQRSTIWANRDHFYGTQPELTMGTSAAGATATATAIAAAEATTDNRREGPALLPGTVERSRLPSGSESPPYSLTSMASTTSSTAPVIIAADPLSIGHGHHAPSPNVALRQIPLAVPTLPVVMPLRAASVVDAAQRGGSTSSDVWTVHISLLPTYTQPFPFERGTNAYKRCLSRGLHQMVAVNGTTAEAFVSAVSKAFEANLRGREWMPLQALPCTAERLAGLPMLRPLDPFLVEEPYDLAFLRAHCAVSDIDGHMDSLYIAMRHETISWHSLKRAPKFLDGLEPSWDFDPLLDVDEPDESGNSDGDDESTGDTTRPPAGAILATLSPLKRTASEMLRSTASFGSAAPTAMAAAATTSAPAATVAEGEGFRPKVPRIHRMPNVEVRSRSVTTS